MAHLHLSVTVLYRGLKAELLTEGLEGIQTLRQDLKAFGLPHPKRENVLSFIPPYNGPYGGCYGFEFFWPSVPQYGVRCFWSPSFD